ncbi:hypothetical protein LIER_36133 [Lithospermum erythrorhizon]|uniref:DUF3741 domain-containing protein n=1 Tax=Lithospermum erythrorhizon TaxID=34254 RepID=A0AAV3P2L5_LITER
MLLEQMLKRQDSLLSSSRRETPPPPQKHHVAATSVGCMSGIFHLITKYQNRNKRLTSGKKHTKSNTSNGNSSSPKRANKASRTTQTSPSANKEVPGSPTPLRPETTSGSKGHRKQPTLVARLMGLEEIPGTISPCNNKVVKKEESDEEKRRKLMQALQRCNNDLATLKKVIKNVQEVEKSVQPPDKVEVGGNGGSDSATPPSRTSCMMNQSDHQRLSHACVIDQRFRSSTIKKPVAASPGEVTPPPCKPPTPRKNPRQDDGIETYFFHKKSLANNKSWDIKHDEISSPSKTRSSKAMIQSVEQVCRDIAWGEKREVGKIGLMVQECIWKDLIEEIVQEMAGCWIHVLPFEACRRRLTFF